MLRMMEKVFTVLLYLFHVSPPHTCSTVTRQLQQSHITSAVRLLRTSSSSTFRRGRTCACVMNSPTLICLYQTGVPCFFFFFTNCVKCVFKDKTHVLFNKTITRRERKKKREKENNKGRNQVKTQMRKAKPTQEIIIIIKTTWFTQHPANQTMTR